MSIKVRTPCSRRCRVVLNLYLGTARSLSGILFHIFAPILDKEFFIWSVRNSQVLNIEK